MFKQLLVVVAAIGSTSAALAKVEHQCPNGPLKWDRFVGKVEQRSGPKEGEIVLMSVGTLFSDNKMLVFSDKDDNYSGRVSADFDESLMGDKSVVLKDNAHKFEFKIPNRAIGRICKDNVVLKGTDKDNKQTGVDLRIFKLEKVKGELKVDVDQKDCPKSKAKSTVEKYTQVYNTQIMITLKQGQEMITMKLAGEEEESAGQKVTVACPPVAPAPDLE